MSRKLHEVDENAGERAGTEHRPPRMEMWTLDRLLPYANNPRDNEAAVPKVAESIATFGFKVPIVARPDGEILAGHTRFKAALRLGLKEVPVLVADDLDDMKAKAFRLADNKVAEAAEWDVVALAKELESIDIEMEAFGFGEDDYTGKVDVDGEVYSAKIETPVYEPKRDTPPAISEMMDSSRAECLVAKIKTMELPDDVRKFFEFAAMRFVKFRFDNIAEYYCHATKEVQKVMEELALVIIDFDKAMELGFVKLTNTFRELMKNDEEGNGDEK